MTKILVTGSMLFQLVDGFLRLWGVARPGLPSNDGARNCFRCSADSAAIVLCGSGAGGALLICGKSMYMRINPNLQRLGKKK